jgi:hypothetical protein
MVQSEEADYADLELLYNAFMEPAMRQALGEFHRGLVGARARRLGLSEADWRAWLRLSDRDSPTNILRHEDYYRLLIGELMVGAVPAPPGDARTRRPSTARRRVASASR